MAKRKAYRKRPAKRTVRRKTKTLRNMRSGGYTGRMSPFGVEKKYFDTVHASAALEDGGMGGSGIHMETSLVAIGTGTGPDERIGRKIVITSIELNGRVRLQGKAAVSPADTYNESSRYRIAVVLDRQCNSAALDSAIGTKIWSATGGKADSMRNLEYSKRFRILKLFEGNLNSPGAFWDPTTAGPSTPQKGSLDTSRVLRWYHKCNIPVENTRTAAGLSTEADLPSNNVFVVGFSEALEIRCVFTARVRYLDA